MTESKTLRVWQWITGMTAIVAFVIVNIYRSFIPVGYITPSNIAPGAYAFLVFWALLTVAAGLAWVVLGVVWLVRRLSREA